jgi:hypothetical protein
MLTTNGQGNPSVNGAHGAPYFYDLLLQNDRLGEGITGF